MPLNKDIKRVLLIGSGPIVIGQAAEFDYAGTQALRALKEDGIEVILVNSNPATIMTDNLMADKVYIEPLTLTTVKRIIKKEKPDSILSGLGGQTGLTLCMQLAKEGFLEEHNVRLLGASPETIDKAEDRQIFKDTMESLGQPVIPSKVVTDVESAMKFANEISYPVIVRPAFTLGGSGGGIAETPEELHEIAENGISLSPINQILVEKSIAGWKEIEFEVMRDHTGNVITVCSMENFDPVGVHTGDSIVIAPTVTLADKEYQMLRSAALKIIEALGVEGGCNCQFALHPESFDYAVIEVNPRVSRSSALASKATGYPIAKVATKIALGYNLDEIKNAVTGKTYAAFEPTLDYVAVKFPKWPFDKFVYAKRDLGTQMKATGEVMSISDTFESALMKAVRGAEISLDTLNLKKLSSLSTEEIKNMVHKVTDERLFAVFEAIKRGVSLDEIHELSKIDKWFLAKVELLATYEKELEEVAKDSTQAKLNDSLYIKGKKLGYTDASIKRIAQKELPPPLKPVYKMVDTCAGEFSAETPYFYQIFEDPSCASENEAEEFVAKQKHNKKTVIVIGSGPIRIGQGIEFDYASVHCVWTLKEAGYEVVIINNNPETVSTDFDTGDRLYFEPLSAEDVLHIIDLEKPIGVVVSFGGGTAIKLTKHLKEHNIPIIGSSADTIDMAEDRERFDELLEKLSVKRPKGFSVSNTQEALEAANKLTYPVLLRPSYVLGGQNMIIAFCDDDVTEYMGIILRQKQDNPVLIDKYMSGTEVEVDAICDGKDILIPGIMEHIERTGIHSGDSIAVYPAPHIDDKMREKIMDTTRKLSAGLNAIGLVNVQYIIVNDEIYVIEVNPRASRTVPYLSKVTGVPMCELATKVSLGAKLNDLGFGTGIYPISPYTAVKVPVFSFEKLTDVDTHLGPEMKSTGEVLGIGKNLEEALLKGLVSAGYKMQKKGGVFITVRNTDKAEVKAIAKKYDDMGFTLYATKGNADVLKAAGMEVTVVNKIHENETDNAMTLLESKKINYIISTSARGRNPARDSVKIRRKASLLGIPCFTALDTANAMAESLMSRYAETNTELVNINDMRKTRMSLKFTKMIGCGNDYIYIDCMNQDLNCPESYSILLSDRHFGIGGDGLILISPSTKAKASMKIFNHDGTEGEMSGNAIRCVAKYVFDNKIIDQQKALNDGITIETASGIKNLSISTRNKLVNKVTVHMGKPELKANLIPVDMPSETVIKQEIVVSEIPYEITCVSMGNPHCVVFMDEVDDLNVSEIGPKFEHHKFFPERINTEFVSVIDKQTLKMRVWERGNGETLSCGTGACAAVVAAVVNGLCDKDTNVKVLLAGGELVIRYTGDEVFMTGDAQTVFEGTVLI